MVVRSARSAARISHCSRSTILCTTAPAFEQVADAWGPEQVACRVQQCDSQRAAGVRAGTDATLPRRSPGWDAQRR